MTGLAISLPHRLLARYGVLIFFVLGLPLATWVVWLLLPLVCNHFGYDPQKTPMFPTFGP